MKTGFTELKRFFSNKDFIWFDTKEIRDRDKLSPEELKYIDGWSLSPFGYGFLFYLAQRRLYDVGFIYIVSYLYVEIYEPFIKPFIYSESLHPLVRLIMALLSMLGALAGLYALIFSLANGRRLSWNRGHATFFGNKVRKWESVDELRQSEKKWFRYSALPSLILLAVSLVGLAYLSLF